MRSDSEEFFGEGAHILLALGSQVGYAGGEGVDISLLVLQSRNERANAMLSLFARFSEFGKIEGPYVQVKEHLLPLHLM